MATKRVKKSAGARPPAPPSSKASSRGSKARKTAAAAKPLAAPRPARRAGPAKQEPAARRSKAASRRAEPAESAKAPAAPAVPVLTDEERIEDAKYQPRTAPKRVFEEERFVFPESYGVTRIRLLVKDPEWIFVHWDVDPKTLADLRAELGERTMALTRLTLRVKDAEHGGGQTILLPPGSRSWYVRADPKAPRAYRAELGVTLPSGGFRALAESNTVVPPRVGPSPEVARSKKRFGRVASASKADAGTSAPVAASVAPVASAEAPSSPWRPRPARTDGASSGGSPEGARAETRRPDRGGSSELPGQAERGGASDVHRR
ncbi:MAG TPA: DUF4912 domain-containing protein [Vicinamibacteria bacterium]|nr:DUF4912 domain-containing protein [Vicinamibacteria bacterium]